MFRLVSFHSSVIAQCTPLKFFELKRGLIVRYWRKAAGSEPEIVRPDMLQVKIASFTD
ncbi:MAG: hypothetical protein KME05_10435 [Gloeocapsa sp. UFS-A4-WI-NPMV-4B04]|nr:hypothetical protein [Gloeocapsa sp. UFS-A4-WI-NPMV-4B04]